MPLRMPLQEAVRRTRARLAHAWESADLEVVAACAAELRVHAVRAEDEADAAGLASRRVVGMLRDLADQTERKLERTV